MTDSRWWAALVTFERRQEGENGILPEWAWGACGWMAVRALNEKDVRDRLARDLAHQALDLIDVDEQHEVFGVGELVQLDDHLAFNFNRAEAHAVTVWGTLYGYKGEGQA